MPRRNRNLRVRATTSANVRQAERDRRRKRLSNRAKHHRSYNRELSDGIRM